MDSVGFTDSEKFRQNVYDVFDKKARDAVRAYFDYHGYYSLSVEDYKADLKVFTIIDGVYYHSMHELEVRTPWDQEEFPYSTVTIPYRKAKLINEKDNLFFWSLNKYLTMGIYVSAKRVNECPVIEKLTTRGIGKFFEVPLCDYTKVSLEV